MKRNIYKVMELKEVDQVIKGPVIDEEGITIKMIITPPNGEGKLFFGFIIEWPDFRADGASVEEVQEKLLSWINYAANEGKVASLKFDINRSAKLMFGAIYNNDRFHLSSYKVKSDQTEQAEFDNMNN